MAEMKSDGDDDEKTDKLPTFLILGGCGFIARHLVTYLVTTKKAGHVIVADKRATFTSYFTKEMTEIYKSPNVTAVQVDLSRTDSIEKKGIFNHKIDFIVNLCGETRFGKSDDDYKTLCLDTALLCAKFAERTQLGKGLRKWIEVSTAQVYEPRKMPPCKETAKIAPFTRLAVHRYEVEKRLTLTKLPVVTLRPSIVYGPDDKTGLTPRLVCAAGYRFTRQPMTFLWTKGVRVNTVHVRDVARAIYVACMEASPGKIYNLSDKGGTTALDLNKVLEKLFGIKCQFQNAAMNAAAAKMMGFAAKVANDTHVPVWADVMKAHGITNTPLSPFLDEEILTKNHLSIDGSLFCKETSFKYTVPKLQVDSLREVCDQYAAQKYFPDLDRLKSESKK